MLKYLSLIALAAYLLAALPMHYEADDWSDLQGLASPLATIRDFYQGWSGRYTYALTKTLAKAGPIWLPTVLVILGLWWLVPDKVLLVACASAAPDLYQSLYWQAGATGYGLFLLGAVALWRLRLKPLTSFLLAFLVAGLSDTGAVALVVLCLVWYVTDRSARPMAALLGATLGILLILLAPGNAVRESYFQRADLLTCLPYALRATGSYLAGAIKQTPWVVLAVFPWQLSKRHDKVLVYVSGALLACFAVSLASFYSIGGPLPGRAAIIPVSICLAALRLSQRREPCLSYLSISSPYSRSWPRVVSWLSLSRSSWNARPGSSATRPTPRTG